MTPLMLAWILLLVTVLSCPAADMRAPTVSIQRPTTSSHYSTTETLVSVGGIARDNKGVSRVTWQTDRGQSGVATGTTSWSFPLTLASGTTHIAVQAIDTAGNTSVPDTLTITLLSPPPPPGPITVEWAYAGTDGESFVLERCTVPCAAMVPVAAVDMAARQWKDTLVAPELDYCYRMAVSEGGLLGPYSNTMCSP